MSLMSGNAEESSTSKQFQTADDITRYYVQDEIIQAHGYLLRTRVNEAPMLIAAKRVNAVAAEAVSPSIFN